MIMLVVHVWGWAVVTQICVHVDHWQDEKSPNSSLWKLVYSGGVKEQLEHEKPNSASQPVTLLQERDLDRMKIWRECLHDSNSCKCRHYSSIFCCFSIPVFLLLLPQMLPRNDGITSTVPRQHLSRWWGLDRSWTCQGLIPGERAQ